jgi:DNA-binding winged helix-turn-helix (wHTH) protein
MRNQHIARDMADRPGTVYGRSVSKTLALAPERFGPFLIHSNNSHPTDGSAKIPLERSNVAELKIHVDGLPILFRFTIDEVSTRTLLAAIATQASPRPEVLEKGVDQIGGSGTRRTRPALTIVETKPEKATVAASPALQTVLRVGTLELNLLDRTAKRGERSIDLRPREFRLLRYMMERNDKLLTRAKLLQDVWNYKFVPKTNLVDVHMGRLRRKVDGPNEPAMIHSIRGAGFVLNANPLPQN